MSFISVNLFITIGLCTNFSLSDGMIKRERSICLSLGGRIDHAHHYNNAYRALDETLALEEAVRAVMKEVDLSETLLVVTADHSHVLTLGGLATHRGNPIFGK